MSDILCIYYSRTGHTRRAVKEIAEALDAEIVAITDGRDRSGWKGYLRSGMDAMKLSTKPLNPFETARPLEEYRLVMDMKIVVLDGCAANSGDISWDSIGKYGELTVYDRTDRSEVVSRIGDAQIITTNKTVIDRAVIEACPNLRYIGVLATGYNVVDVEAAHEHGIVVTNVPAYSTDAVAQFTFALLLELANRVGAHDASVKDGGWVRSRDFSYSVMPTMELAGKTMGIIGYGSIGMKVAEIAHAFGMRVLVNSRTRKALPDGDWISWAERDELFAQSDVISIHCPLFPETEGMIDRSAIGRMKKTTFIINTARGGCIVEKDLADALNEERIAGAAVDVIAQEPMAADNPLLTAKNVIITPHIAWAPKEVRERLLNIAGGNIEAFLNGKPVNTV